ncbi:hypothetical protein TNCV_317821 [Trichonephila clavipes]|nr:hypothetical protein TNCV_317821 [Trichonephila clavipes]
MNAQGYSGHQMIAHSHLVETCKAEDTLCCLPPINGQVCSTPPWSTNWPPSTHAISQRLLSFIQECWPLDNGPTLGAIVMGVRRLE